MISVLHAQALIRFNSFFRTALFSAIVSRNLKRYKLGSCATVPALYGTWQTQCGHGATIHVPLNVVSSAEG